jgi:hypothetical protein
LGATQAVIMVVGRNELGKILLAKAEEMELLLLIF